MRNWSFPDTLKRVGIPAGIIFIGMTVQLVLRRDPGEAVSEIILWNAVIFALLWLSVSAVMWIVTPKSQ